MNDNDSMLVWFPKIKDLPIPQPETEIVVIKNRNDIVKLCDGDFSPLEKQWGEIICKARKIGFPLFMRTDHLSGKHSWKNTCFVEKEEDLKTHISSLVEESFCADILGVPVNALVFRKYIEMECKFRAFRDMPVNTEIRFFINDGEILCNHFYWIDDAFERASRKPPNWKELLREMKDSITGKEFFSLKNDCRKVAERFPEGYFSVDFCKGKDGKFYLIDMASGKNSWHPDCVEKLRVIDKEVEP